MAIIKLLLYESLEWEPGWRFTARSTYGSCGSQFSKSGVSDNRWKMTENVKVWQGFTWICCPKFLFFRFYDKKEVQTWYGWPRNAMIWRNSILAKMTYRRVKNVKILKILEWVYEVLEMMPGLSRRVFSYVRELFGRRNPALRVTRAETRLTVYRSLYIRKLLQLVLQTGGQRKSVKNVWKCQGLMRFDVFRWA